MSRTPGRLSGELADSTVTADVARRVMALIDTFVSARRHRLPRTLARLAQELDGVDGAAVVEARAGDDSLEVVGFSTEDYRHLTDVQTTDPVGGPAVEVMRSTEPVLLERNRGDAPGWAVLQPTADELGLRYVYAVPLRSRNDVLGSLVVFGRDLRYLSDSDRHQLETLAQVAAIGLAQVRMVRSANERADQLQGALSTRMVIEQAKGVLLTRGYANLDAAFEALRGQARQQRKRVDDVARAVVQEATSADAVLPRQRVEGDEAAEPPPDPAANRANRRRRR